MASTIIAIANVALVIALCVSIAKFLSESRHGAESVRRLAALSCALTLLITILIYSGEFRRNALAALGYVGASPSLYDSAGNALGHFDDICTQIANGLNDLLGAAHVGYRPYPPLWPVLLLAVGYGIRFLIYRLHKKTKNFEAAMTGAVYLSHITTYGMVMAFLIVIAGVDPLPLIPLSLLVLVLVIVSIKLVVEDVGATIRALLHTLWTEITRVAGRIAYLATAIAAAVRTALAYANEIYLERVRNPLRKRLDVLEKRNEAAKGVTRQRLKDQEEDYRRRFGDSARKPRHKP